MQDVEFFEKVLGVVEPWEVKSVKMDLECKRVEVEVACRGKTVWAEGGRRLHIHGYEKRRWRHLDTMQLETVITAQVPRIKREDGSTEVVNVPWAERFSRLTRMMEGFVIQVLQASSSVSKASQLLGLSWETVDGVMKRAVERGLMRRQAEPIRHLGVDEKSIGRGHQYATVLNDIDGTRVWEVVERRDEAAAQQALETLEPEQKASVEAVAMDMWPAYMKAVAEQLPQARIVHDKFHVSKHLNEAVDLVRKQEHRRLMSQGDERLKGSKYQWLRGFEDLRHRGAREFRHLYGATLKTSRAWRLKETFTDFWSYRYETPAAKFFAAWKKSALLTRLEPVRKVAKLLANHLPGLLNYSSHPITNAASEGFNSLIQTLIANARGLRSFSSLRSRILFYCGKLNLMPNFPSSPSHTNP